MHAVHTCTSHFCMGVTQFKVLMEKEQQYVLHNLKIIQNKSRQPNIKLSSRIVTRMLNKWAMSLQVKLSANKSTVKLKEQIIFTAPSPSTASELPLMSQRRALDISVTCCLEMSLSAQRKTKQTVGRGQQYDCCSSVQHVGVFGFNIFYQSRQWGQKQQMSVEDAMFSLFCISGREKEIGNMITLLYKSM